LRKALTYGFFIKIIDFLKPFGGVKMAKKKKKEGAPAPTAPSTPSQ
jgi:hypothetical protein